MAQGRASAWGGAPHSCSPSAGGKRLRLISPCPPPAVQEAATEGAETDAAGARSPLFRPKKRVGCRPKRLHVGSGTAWWEQGASQNTSLLVIEFGVCHLSFFIWPSACAPHAPQGGSCLERCGIKELGAQVPWHPGPCPVGPAPSVPGADRLVSRRGEGGEDGATRVPCPLPGWAPATACSPSGTLPAVRNRRFTPYLFSHSCFPLPPLFCQKDPGRLTALSSGPSRLPYLPPRPRLLLWGPQSQRPGQSRPRRHSACCMPFCDPAGSGRCCSP